MKKCTGKKNKVFFPSFFLIKHLNKTTKTLLIQGKEENCFIFFIFSCLKMHFKVLTNEKRGGLKVVSFNRSPFQIFSLWFSNKSVRAPSCERPKTALLTLFLLFANNNCIPISTSCQAATNFSQNTIICNNGIVRGASKIKWKKVNKRRMVTVRRVILFEYLKASIADLITLLSSSVQNSEGGDYGDSGDICADTCQEFKQGFLGVSSGLPPCLIISRICLNISDGDMTQ
jgi:hypothetical protein